jgi:hypothetical protein
MEEPTDDLTSEGSYILIIDLALLAPETHHLVVRHC